MKLNRKIRRYALVVLVTYAIVAALIGANYLVLYRTGELADLDKVVAAQQRHGGLYKGLSVGLAAYKYEGYRQRRPDIVAIGTSRAMQIRDYFFAQPFYNLGGLVHGQVQAFALWDRLLTVQPPKTVVFAVDFWTFCSRKTEFPPFQRPTGSFHDGLGDPSNPFLLTRLFAEEKLSAEDLELVFRRIFDPPQRALPRIGISTLINDGGFGADGSLFSLVAGGSIDFTPEVEDRSHFQIEALRRGEGRFLKDCRVGEENLSLLRMLGTELAEHGVELVVIAPPITRALFNAIEKVPPAKTYMTTWRRRLKEAWPRTYDFTDPKSVGTNDCEFYDGIHGGEVAYARIFRTIAETRSDEFTRLLNIENLDRIIDVGKNKVTVALGFPEKVREIELGGFKPCVSLQK